MGSRRAGTAAGEYSTTSTVVSSSAGRPALKARDVGEQHVAQGLRGEVGVGLQERLQSLRPVLLARGVAALGESVRVPDDPVAGLQLGLPRGVLEATLAPSSAPRASSAETLPVSRFTT